MNEKWLSATFLLFAFMAVFAFIDSVLEIDLEEESRQRNNRYCDLNIPNPLFREMSEEIINSRLFGGMNVTLSRFGKAGILFGKQSSGYDTAQCLFDGIAKSGDIEIPFQIRKNIKYADLEQWRRKG